MNSAHRGDTPRIGPGTYYENVVIQWHSLTLVGASAGETTVDGKFKGPVFVLGPQNGGATPTTTLSVTLADMTITHGKGVTGGGIAQNVSAFEVRDSIIESNIATQSGGGMEVEAFSVKPSDAVTTAIKNCVIANNQGPQGAGILIEPEIDVQIS